jgi:hypothetical protein
MGFFFSAIAVDRTLSSRPVDGLEVVGSQSFEWYVRTYLHMTIVDRMFLNHKLKDQDFRELRRRGSMHELPFNLT